MCDEEKNYVLSSTVSNWKLVKFIFGNEPRKKPLKQFSANDDANFSNNLIRKNGSDNFLLVHCIGVSTIVFFSLSLRLHVCKMRRCFKQAIHSKHISCRLHFTFLFTISMPFRKSHTPRNESINAMCVSGEKGGGVEKYWLLLLLTSSSQWCAHLIHHIST